MKLRLLLLNFLFFAFINAVLAEPVKPEVKSDNIISLTAAQGTEIAAAQSLNSRPFLSSRKLYEIQRPIEINSVNF